MRSGPLEPRAGLVHRYGMDGRRWIGRHRFWPLALLWLPALGSLAPVVPCGLPLPLGCRRLWRLGYRRAAWAAGVGLGALTIPVAVFAGLLGPLAIAAGAVVLSLPVWIAWWWLARHG